MLLELAVTDLGVLRDVSLLLGRGLTALTGETGAGKTLLVEALELLVGGRADAVLVRPGAAEARVEGRFVVDGEEVVLSRVVPRDGRSRAYVDGRLATAGALAEWGARLVDLHGQHAHQSLLGTAVQRAALDRFGAVDGRPLADAKAALAAVDDALAAIGGDERARARELDLFRFQVAELDAAALADPDEDQALEVEEQHLADAVAHQEAAVAAGHALTGEGGAADTLASAVGEVAGRAPFAAAEARLRSLAAELADTATELRSAGEAITDDPERLAAVRQRRQLLHELRRKYGATLAEVMVFHRDTAARMAELEHHDARAIELDRQRAEADKAVAEAAAAVGRARRAAAPGLARAVAGHLTGLAMPRAGFEVDVGPDPGDEVTFLLAANPGSPPLLLAKVASGGELARAMLALRLALLGASRGRDGGGGDRGGGPATLVFDEVDAGIGGTAAAAVGRSLAALAGDRQVLVVTHLPQVAAYADVHVAVTKTERRDSAVATAAVLNDADRVVELSRMLSGQPDSTTARHHAEELLARAAQERPGA